MGYVYDRRRTPGTRNASEQAAGTAPQGYTMPSVPNSALLAAAGIQDSGGMGLDALRSAMDVKLAALRHQIPAAEAEADRLSRSVAGTTPEQVRSEMGQRMGADFSGVRFHTDAASASRAEEMGARAWTQGNDVYFGPDGFNPSTAAHELVHTVQQGAVEGGVSTVSAPMGAVQMAPWEDDLELSDDLDNDEWLKRYRINNTVHELYELQAALRDETLSNSDRKKMYKRYDIILDSLITTPDAANRYNKAGYKDTLGMDVMRDLHRRSNAAGRRMMAARAGDMDPNAAAADFRAAWSDDSMDYTNYQQLINQIGQRGDTGEFLLTNLNDEVKEYWADKTAAEKNAHLQMVQVSESGGNQYAQTPAGQKYKEARKAQIVNREQQIRKAYLKENTL